MSTFPVLALTGASGQIGSWVLRYALEAGYRDIRCLSRRPQPAVEDGRVTWMQGDITDLFTIDSFLEGVDVLIHTAGIVSYRRRDEHLMKAVNIQGTANLVNLALHQGVGHFLHMSSSATLGRDQSHGPLDESSVWASDAPSSVYALTKYEAELEVWRGMEEGLGVSILNPVIVLDPDQRGRSTRVFVEAVRQGIRGYPTGSHGFVDVRDVARAALALVERGPSGQRVLLSGGHHHYQEVLAGLATAMDCPVPDRAMTLTRALWLNRWARWLGRKALSDREVEMAYEELMFDTTRAREVYGLGFLSLEESLIAIGQAAGRRR
ncbi:MAG: NAD-dependent epimerase/dehydratase family protein [Saprospiraceae bacterium]